MIEVGKAHTRKGKYRHWDVLRHLETPVGISHEQWWLGIKLARAAGSRPLGLVAIDGNPFQYVLTDDVFEMLHEIDKTATGSIGASEQVTNPQTRDRYLFTSLVEEAITSSQLEGASTTRAVAKEMITTGRRPRNVGERMIQNNYNAMRFIHEIKDENLTPEIVIELQRILTQDTLREPDAVGRLRRADEPINIQDEHGHILHTPPVARELTKRMKAMCEFANGAASDGFLHPVLRAMFLHFWLAYDHPFIDGNGRTARALFYWSMARQKYWLIEFISISRILKSRPGKYAEAFLHTETDDNDATYFFLDQLDVIRRATQDLQTYLDRKSKELFEASQLLRHATTTNTTFNHRQLAVLHHAINNPYQQYTVESHARSHAISIQTSRTDLEKMHAAGMLERSVVGKAFVYVSPPDLKLRITQLVDKP